MIVISEIMQNPSAVSDSNGEWFEVTNTSGTGIDINGWTIQDNDNDLHVIDNGGPLIVPAGGYLVLGNNANSATNGGFTVDYEFSSFFIANGADEIVLIDADGNEVDRVEYDGGPGFPDPNGASMYLADLNADNNVASNWAEASEISYGAGDFGTPGAPNECFLTGTLIQTENGEVLVEELKIGDKVQTADGKLETVKWIGYQTVEPSHVDRPLRGYPVQIKAGALGNNLPQRDLYVSPDHALLVEGLLINAGALVNGTSIVRTEPTETFIYHHIELDNHALLVAEGTFAESYLPQKEDRMVYDNGAEYEELYPNGSNLILWPMSYPRVSSQNKLPRFVKKKLNQIAKQLGLAVEAA